MTPIVEAGLRAITDRVNLTTGLGHPLDKTSAAKMFAILRDHGEILSGDEIASWASVNGWRAKDAADLGRLASTVAEGGRVRMVEGGGWADNIIEVLEKEIAGE